MSARKRARAAASACAWLRAPRRLHCAPPRSRLAPGAASAPPLRATSAQPLPVASGMPRPARGAAGCEADGAAVAAAEAGAPGRAGASALGLAQSLEQPGLSGGSGAAPPRGDASSSSCAHAACAATRSRSLAAPLPADHRARQCGLRVCWCLLLCQSTDTSVLQAARLGCPRPPGEGAHHGPSPRLTGFCALLHLRTRQTCALIALLVCHICECLPCIRGAPALHHGCSTSLTRSTWTLGSTATVALICEGVLRTRGRLLTS